MLDRLAREIAFYILGFTDHISFGRLAAISLHSWARFFVRTPAAGTPLYLQRRLLQFEPSELEAEAEEIGQ